MPLEFTPITRKPSSAESLDLEIAQITGQSPTPTSPMYGASSLYGVQRSEVSDEQVRINRAMRIEVERDSDQAFWVEFYNSPFV